MLFLPKLVLFCLAFTGTTAMTPAFQGENHSKMNQKHIVHKPELKEIKKKIEDLKKAEGFERSRKEYGRQDHRNDKNRNIISIRRESIGEHGKYI